MAINQIVSRRPFPIPRSYLFVRDVLFFSEVAMGVWIHGWLYPDTNAQDALAIPERQAQRGDRILTKCSPISFLHSLPNEACSLYNIRIQFCKRRDSSRTPWIQQNERPLAVKLT